MRLENRVKWSSIRRGDFYAKYEASQCFKMPFGETIDDGTLVRRKEYGGATLVLRRQLPFVEQKEIGFS